MRRLIPRWLGWIVVGWTTIAVGVSLISQIISLDILHVLLSGLPALIMTYFGWYYLLEAKKE